MTKHFYRGRPVPSLVQEYSYPRHGKKWSNDEFHKNLTIDQRLEIDRSDAEELARRITAMKTPISVNHKTIRGRTITVGRVEEASVSEDGAMDIVFSIDSESDGGEFVHRMLKSGSMRELSLKHDHTNLIPFEMSICNEGCRPGTTISEINDSEYKPPSSRNSSSFGQQSNHPVIVSASVEDMMNTTGQQGQAAAAQPVQPAQPAQPQGAANPSQQSQPMEGQQTQQQQQQSAAIDSAVEKLVNNRALLTKEERKALLEKVNRSEKLETEVVANNEQRTHIFVNQVLTLLKNLTGREDLMNMENDTVTALKTGNGAALDQNLGPVLVAANRQAMERMGSANAYATIGGSVAGMQTQEQIDPEILAAAQEYQKYKNSRASFVLPGMSPAYHNASLKSLPPVVVSANRESMYQQSQPAQQFFQPAGSFSALPRSQYTDELNYYANQNFGSSFKPNQVLTDSTLASMGAPVGKAAQNGANYSSSSGSSSYASQPFNFNRTA